MATASKRPDTAESIPRVAWADMAASISEHFEQGQHIAVVGPTGSGKTVLCTELVTLLGARLAADGRPARVVALGTKPRDRSLSALKRRGFVQIKKWPPSYAQEHVIVWPKYGDPDTAKERQSRVFRALLNRIFAEGGQTVYIDELATFSDPPPEGLGLSRLMNEYFTNARALDISVIAGTQRPRNVPRSMWSEPSLVFIFTPDDDDDLKRVAEIGRKQQVLDAVPHLAEHEFLAVGRRGYFRGKIAISRVEIHY